MSMDELAQALNDGFGRIHTRLDSIETRLDSIETRLDSIETRLDAIETRLDAIETRLDKAETDLETIRQGVDITAKAVMRLEGRCDAIARDLKDLSREFRARNRLDDTRAAAESERFENFNERVDRLETRLTSAGL